MANVFLIDNTDGTLSITLKPGALNGPGADQRDTDMRLYGMGSLLWGEGVNENILRLAENFACEEKSGTPGVPQDENDITNGFARRLGINNPLTGQTWYNKSDEQMYFYTGSVWKKTSAVIVNITTPDSAETGDMWYDLGYSDGCSLPVLKLYDPTHPSAAPDGWVELGFDRLSICGGDMSGTLSMSSDGGTTRNQITNLGDPINDYDAIHKLYLEQQLDLITGPGGSLTSHLSDGALHLSTRQNEMLDSLESTCMGSAADAVRVATDICALKGWSLNTVDTVWTAMDRRLRKDGGTMTNFLTLHANPSSDFHAATKKYVDDEVGRGLGSGATRYIRFFNSISGGSPDDGDVAVQGSIVYIYQDGWKQVFPAIYS